ncbi:MAG: DUF6095 family protein [Flavobacteriaceae bacterium]
MDLLELRKGLRRMAIFISMAFIGPVIIYQAFQNEGHPFYIPVLVVGLLLCILAIGFGFWGIRSLTHGLLGPKKPKKGH